MTALYVLQRGSFFFETGFPYVTSQAGLKLTILHLSSWEVRLQYVLPCLALQLAVLKPAREFLQSAKIVLLVI
jgi:hypothetical protein